MCWLLCLAAVVGHGRHRALRITVSQLLQTVIRHYHLLRRRQPAVSVFCSQPRDCRRITQRMRATSLLPVRQSLWLCVGGHGLQCGHKSCSISAGGRRGRLLLRVGSDRTRRRRHVRRCRTPSGGVTENCCRETSNSYCRERVTLPAFVLHHQLKLCSTRASSSQLS